MPFRLAALTLALAAAGSAAAQSVVTLWVHAGAGPEAAAYSASVKAFNDSRKDIRVDLVRLPEGSYNDQMNAAALARKLPCLLDFDGPNVYSYAWTRKIIPLDDHPELVAIARDMLPSLQRQGTFAGRLYTLAQFDSGLALWGNRKLLAKAGVRLPAKVADAWTLAELEDALRKLKAAGVPYPLDMKFNYGMGEWFTYGFSPIVQSLGGDLVDRKTYRSARGVINGPQAVQALTLLQGWVKAGYVNAATKDDSDFAKGRAALSYVGHWVYGDYKKALGDDLVLLPMPRFGSRAVTGAGSWNFGISANCKDPKAAASVLAYLMSPEEIARTTDANGAVPGTRSALARSKLHGPDGPLALYAEQINSGLALVRPETPAYPAISTAFAEAVNNIVAGAGVQAELDRAAKKIDQTIDDNKGYPVK